MVKRHKNHCGTAARIYTTVVTLLLIVAIILTGCGFGLGWVQLTLTSGSVSQDTEQDNTTEDNGGMVVTEGESSGAVTLSMTKLSAEDYTTYSVSTQAESAYTLTAVISPSSATIKTVDWSVSFKDPSSIWASGKTVTDYVTVTPTSDGALTATVECLQAFGEQIIVTVTPRQNSAVKATCTVDYARRILDTALYDENAGYILNYGEDEAVVDLVMPTTYAELQTQMKSGTVWYGGTWQFVYSDCTIYDDYSVSLTVTASSCANLMNFEMCKEFMSVGLLVNQMMRNEVWPLISNNPVAMIYSFIANWFICVDGSAPDMTEEIYLEYIEYFVENYDSSTPFMTYTYTYTGTYSTFERTFTLSFNPDTVIMPVSGVSVDNSVVF